MTQSREPENIPEPNMMCVPPVVREALFDRPFSKEEKRLIALPEQDLLTQQNALAALSETSRLRVFISYISTNQNNSPDFLMSLATAMTFTPQMFLLAAAATGSAILWETFITRTTKASRRQIMMESGFAL